MVNISTRLLQFSFCWIAGIDALVRHSHFYGIFRRIEGVRKYTPSSSRGRKFPCEAQGSSHLESFSTNTELADHSTIEKIVRDWVQEWVVNLGLCPWAAGVTGDKYKLRVVVDNTQLSSLVNESQNSIFSHAIEEMSTIIQLVCDEAKYLITNKDGVETTLLVFSDPYINKDFLAFWDLVMLLEELVLEDSSEKLSENVQFAHFHPNFQFESTSAEDVGNYTNRAPYGILHLLRVKQVAEAIEQVNGNTEQIWKNNILRLQSMGIDEVRQLQDTIAQKRGVITAAAAAVENGKNPNKL